MKELSLVAALATAHPNLEIKQYNPPMHLG